MDIINKFKNIIGSKNVLDNARNMRRYINGYRYGQGTALAVLRPGTLWEMWQVLEICVEHQYIIICQAANTGLTGGSSPVEKKYDRPVVIISTLRLNKILNLNEKNQALCQPGVALNQLEKYLKPLGLEPHSVIGSSCLGATVTGGVCNNSGGSLIQRGPSFTQFALYARVNETSKLELINDLDLMLGETPKEILTNLELNIDDYKERNNDSNNKTGSDHDYQNHIRDINSPIPARFNADPRRLNGASGSSGKIAIFAIKVDTFPRKNDSHVIYIGSNQPNELQKIRRGILSSEMNLPISAEYMHKSAYDISRNYGKDLFIFIKYIGTEYLDTMISLKSRFDNLCESVKLSPYISDYILQNLSKLFPNHLPKKLEEWRKKYDHHLIMKVEADQLNELTKFLNKILPSATGAYFTCTKQEGNTALLHRFVVGAAVVRYRTIHHEKVEDIVALDIALPRNSIIWFESLPNEISTKIDNFMYCGHFFCHVMHQEYLIKKGENCSDIKTHILKLIDEKGAKYPAEHNVGHQYEADQNQIDFYRNLDPTNTFNPGIGKTSKNLNWQ